MSIYAIHKFLFQLRNNEAFERRVVADPYGVLEEMDLTPEERTAMASGDVRTLYEMGVHAYLLQVMVRPRLFGLTPDNYFKRIRGEESPEDAARTGSRTS